MRSLIIILLLFSAPSFASYRVYQLKVTSYDSRGKVKGVKRVVSNLDHLQYEHYHAAYRNTKVEYLDSWYCPGDTHRRAYCKKPKGAKRAPTLVEGTRVTLPRAR